MRPPTNCRPLGPPWSAPDRLNRLAEDTLRGLERNQAVLVIPSEMHRTWLLFRLVPGLVESRTLAMTRAMRKTVGHTAPEREAKQPA
jgi:hypothetical protein